MSKPKYIYILPEFANKIHLKNIRTQIQDEYKLIFSKNELQITLSETNSLIEDEYCLNFKSAKFILESEVKESMIHHHETGHDDKHLQFKLFAKGEEIRIFLEKLDEEDYRNCIKGFLYISKELILQEQKNNNIEEDLSAYFFNDEIEQLVTQKNYLLRKIYEAYKNKKILNNKDKYILKNDLFDLRRESHLNLFLQSLF